MSSSNGFNFVEVQFDKRASIHDEAEVTELLQALSENPVTDLVVLAHGWNNDLAEARALYERLRTSMRAVISEGHAAALAGRTLLFLDVLWPSKKFADSDMIASGAASLDGGVTAAIESDMDTLAEALDDPQASAALENAKNLLANIEDDPASANSFAEVIRGLLGKDAVNDEDASANFFDLSGETLMDRLKKPLPGAIQPGMNKDAGGAAVIGSLIPPPPMMQPGAAFLGGALASAKEAARKLLNFATYYLMKGRSGEIGSNGVSPLLRRVMTQRPGLRVHLVGHSFGARLVTATAARLGEEPATKVASLSLLQAAFSHHGFAENFDGGRDGFFRSVAASGCVSGPIIITHTINDTAVGRLYPLASLLVGEDAAALGDENDRFGGIGRNGAQKTPEAVQGVLKEVGENYQFAAGKFFNLESSEFIENHSDVSGRQAAQAVLAAISA